MTNLTHMGQSLEKHKEDFQRILKVFQMIISFRQLSIFFEQYWAMRRVVSSYKRTGPHT